jgi:putative membrane protein
MAEEIKIVTSEPISNNELAMERTVLAHERTLIAWVRTAVSLISFGFTIYKFLGEIDKTHSESNQIFSPRIVGMIMIGFGLVALLLAQVQHIWARKKIKKYYPNMQRSVSSLLAILVLVFGMFLFISAVLRQ